MLTARKPLPVARQLRHANSEITARVYEHLLDDALEAFEPCSRIARRTAQPAKTERDDAQTRI